MALLWIAALVFVVGAAGAYKGRDTMRVLFAGAAIAVLGILLTFSWPSFLAAAVTGVAHFLAVGHYFEQEKEALEELADDAREGDVTREDIEELVETLDDPDSEIRGKARSALVSVPDEFRGDVLDSLIAGSTEDWSMGGDAVDAYFAVVRLHQVRTRSDRGDALDAYFAVVQGTFRNCSADRLPALLDRVDELTDEAAADFYMALAVTGIVDRPADADGRTGAETVADRLVDLLSDSVRGSGAQADAVMLPNAVCCALAVIARTEPDRVRPAVDTLIEFVEEYDEQRARESVDLDREDGGEPLVAHDDAAAALAEVAGAYPREMADHAPRFRQWLDDDLLQPGVVRALGGLAETHPDEVRPVQQELERLLGDDQPMVRIEAARTLAALGETDRPVSTLREILADDDPMASARGDLIVGPRALYEEVHRETVAGAVANIEDDVELAVIAGNNAFVRVEAARTLFEIAADDADRVRAFDALIEVCEGDAFQTRAAACLADLAESSPAFLRDHADRLASALFQYQYYVPNEAEINLCRALGEVCETVPHQLRTLADDSAEPEEVREAAEVAIDRIESRSEAGSNPPETAETTARPDSATGDTAAGSAAGAAVDADGETGAAAAGDATGDAGEQPDHAETSADTDAEAGTSAAGQSADEQATQPQAEAGRAATLVEQLEAPEVGERRETADRLAELTESDPDTVEPHAEAVSAALDAEADSTVRERLVRALGHLDSEPAREALREARRDPDPAVSQRAMELLD